MSSLQVFFFNTATDTVPFVLGPGVPEGVGEWSRGAYHFATNRKVFWRNLVINLGLFAAAVWLAKNLSDIDLMAPQSGL
uniref:Translocase of outer mitochondrial membrane 6 n=1 Tax=Monodelphis domestica TaxID=13616 RepID=A0A5F8GK74_MONDO